MHNILQGVSEPGQRLSKGEQESITGWIQDNAERYWLSEGGPLRPADEGGADIIVVSQRCCRSSVESPWKSIFVQILKFSY